MYRVICASTKPYESNPDAYQTKGEVIKEGDSYYCIWDEEKLDRCELRQVAKIFDHWVSDYENVPQQGTVGTTRYIIDYEEIELKGTKSYELVVKHR